MLSPGKKNGSLSENFPYMFFFPPWKGQWIENKPELTRVPIPLLPATIETGHLFLTRPAVRELFGGRREPPGWFYRLVCGTDARRTSRTSISLHDAHDCVILHGERDFEDIIKVTDQ